MDDNFIKKLNKFGDGQYHRDIKFVSPEPKMEISNFILTSPKDSHKFEVYPHDIFSNNFGILTYIEAKNEVDKLGQAWRIPTLEELFEVYKNRDEFENLMTGSDSNGNYPWYWSSTTAHSNDGKNTDVGKYMLRFTDGQSGARARLNSENKGIHPCCRPVRTVS